MPSINSLLAKIKQDFPGITFTEGADFIWSAENQTIYYSPSDPEASSYLLHELAHAELKHAVYERDIELIRQESQAWDYAINQLAKHYNVTLDGNIAQSSLDTYRDWLHSRSTCPHCGAIGVQARKFSYRCLACQGNWKVNEARTCGLRRYKK